MLENIHIENYALIEKLSLEFSPGMNTLTGETGAGKSILAGALNLLLGVAASATFIRNGENQAVVSGTFLLPREGEAGTDSRKWLEEHGIESEDERVIIRRVLKTNGKGGSYLQGAPVMRQQLAEFTSMLIDMHGQHEHQSLFNIQQHRRFLDAFGDCRDLQQKVQREFVSLSDKKSELQSLQANKKEQEREAELLRFAMVEINELDPQIGEDEALEGERQKLLQHGNLFSHIEQAYVSLKGAGGGALVTLYNSMTSCKSAAVIDPSQKGNAERIESLYYELEDIFSQLSSYKNGLHYDPQRLEFIERRLADLSRLQKKYGPRIEDVRNYYSVASEKLEKLSHSEDYTRDLIQEMRSLEKTLMESAEILSQKRKKVAAVLETEVQTSLLALGMPKATFKVQITQKLSARKVPLCGPFGFERIEFCMSANKGEPLKALKDIASGGEISRVMLAIKNALAESDNIPTLVFDEIDSGIGGEVGRVLGEHLKTLSGRKQILSITHLASIAAYADTHIQVNKIEQGERTLTIAKEVRGAERVTEVARMLSGYSDTEASIEHARQLLKSASN